MNDKDREYYTRRRDECLLRAKNVKDPGIARIHRDFADHYAKALAPLDAGAPR